MYLEQDFHAGRAEYRFRATERMPIHLEGRLKLPDGTETALVLRDISGFGFMAECDIFVGICSTVELTLPGLKPLRAEVRWALADWIGCKFDEELGWDTLSLLIGVEQDALAS